MHFFGATGLEVPVHAECSLSAIGCCRHGDLECPKYGGIHCRVSCSEASFLGHGKSSELCSSLLSPILPQVPGAGLTFELCWQEEAREQHASGILRRGKGFFWGFSENLS